MKKFEGVLFCTDLDGTLYSNDKKVSKENLDAIEYFKSEGGLFTFITGRVPTTSVEMCNIIKPNAPYGCLNGGGIFDPRENRLLFSIALPEEAKELIGTDYDGMPDMGIQLCTENKIYFPRDNDAMAYFRSVTGAPLITCDYATLDETVLKGVFAHNDSDRIEALKELLNSHPLASQFDFIRSERRLYEILPKNASKGNLLIKLAELLGIDRKRTIAVGDYNNDVSMVELAGVGFAVANAIDEVKAAADYITVDNNHSAIAAIIDRLDKGDPQI